MFLEKINLEEVINPQFAFPIVGVILCALLVFAFGFKTPAQPPSFDFVEIEHRKVTSKKKQKTKAEKQSKPVQNGTSVPQPGGRIPPNSNAADSNNKTKENSSKNSKAKELDKQLPNKNDTKMKGKKGSSINTNVKEEKKERAPAPANEENVGGEWVQLISKKERKNRRKEDGIVTEVEKILNEKSKGANSPAKSKKKKPVEALKKEVIQLVEVAAKVEPEPEIIAVAVEPKKTPKVAKKQAATPKEEEVAAVTEKAKEAKTPEILNHAEKKAEVKKKAETKKEEPKEITIEVKKEKVAEVKKEIKKETKKMVEIKKEEVKKEIEDKTTEEIKVESKETSKPDATNVVFDELGDSWQDAKPQKKKKKARRD